MERAGEEEDDEQIMREEAKTTKDLFVNPLGKAKERREKESREVDDVKEEIKVKEEEKEEEEWSDDVYSDLDKKEKKKP